MTAGMDCAVCARNQLVDPPPRERVAEDRHWRVAHAFDTSLPGWLVLVPRRHVVTVADLTDDEARGLGTWQVRLSRALRAATGCAKTYVVQFAEAEGFSHVHFHIVPRPGDLPPDRRGPRVFAFLGAAEDERVDAARTDALALSLRTHLDVMGGMVLTTRDEDD